MTELSEHATMTAKPKGQPSRLHHYAYVTTDMEQTRQFYEDLIGLPLIAAWTETDVLYGAERVYCHTFYGLKDGGALAFFQFADAKDHEEFKALPQPSAFVHIALNCDHDTQQGIWDRCAAAGYDDKALWALDHGYCRSIYVYDPNGLIVEFTVDHPDVDAINAHQLANAHRELARWLAGDHTSNNPFR